MAKPINKKIVILAGITFLIGAVASVILGYTFYSAHPLLGLIIACSSIVAVGLSSWFVIKLNHGNS